MKRIGVYGGIFDPPHMGHVRAAQYALSALKLDRLLLIPSYNGPDTALRSRAPTGEQRRFMTTLTAKQIPGAQVLDIDLRHGSIGLDARGINALCDRFPEDELILLMDTDVFLSLQKWQYVQMPFKNCSLGVFCREKGNLEALMTQQAILESSGVRVYLLKNSIRELSYADIRRMLAFGCADEFLDPETAKYIYENQLYETGGCLKNLSMQQLERAVTSLLKANRVAHVLGCRDTAVELARHWGANEIDAARAGLLHDITKALDGPLQLTLCRAYGMVLDDFYTKNSKPLHALTGALVARRIFGENEAVVSAIRWHTTGKADMTLLEKIIYVADYMEPNRKFSGVEQLRTLAYTDLDSALKCGLEMTASLLKQQGSVISPRALEALQWLLAKRE